MKFFRNVLHDLVEKRLWPVAAALVIALVAVPVLLGRGSGDSGDTAGATAAVPTGTGGAPTAHAATADVVSLEAQAAGKVDRAGKTRNPFVQHHLPKPAKAAVTNGPSSANQLAGGLGGGSSSSSSTGGGAATPAPAASTPPATPAAPKPNPNAKATYHVTLTFGEDGAMKKYNNIARLTPLPSTDNPFFVFLGVKDDGKSAVFLVDSSAMPSGDGKCEPSPEECQQIVLHKGDLEFFQLPSGTAGVVQYQMEIKDITKGLARTTAAAASAHRRESKAGRDYIRSLVATDPGAIVDWSYNAKLGVLIQKAPEVANVPRSVAAAAAGEPVENTSTVLTVPAAPQP